MKKIYLIAIGLIIAAIVTMCGVMIPKQAEGNSKTEQQIETSVETTQLLYAIDGRQINVSKDDVEKYLELWWYELPVMYVYAPDGRTEIIPIKDLSAWEQVGWYYYPVVTVYSPDKAATVISIDILNEWKAAGWYEYPVARVYASDGRESIIAASEVDNWISAGWYRTREEACPKTYSRNPFVKTNLAPSELEKCLSKGLKGYGYAFYQMEQTYGVNAIFAISVAELESGSGTSSAFRNKNNAFGIGPGKYFNSVQEGINYFGQLMNKSLYKGKTITQIGSIYCVGGNWANKIKNLIEQNYQQL